MKPALTKPLRVALWIVFRGQPISQYQGTKTYRSSNSFAFSANESYDDQAFRDSEIKLVEARFATMKFPGGLNIQGMMKQAQQMQEKMAREMEELRVEASAGGGVVTVQMKGNHEIISLKVDPEIVKENDIEMLQDMVVAAINEANRKCDEAMKSTLGSMLPPGLGNLF